MLIIALRTFIMYSALLFALRLMGKSELSKMSPFQLVVVFMIAELAAIPIDSADASLINGLMAIFTLTFLQILCSYISIKNESFKNFISGKPTILINKGKINIEELQKQRISITDLMEQLRVQNMPSINEIKFAVLESNGQLSIINKNILPAILISDGHFYEHNLVFSGMDHQSFLNKLRSINLTSFEDIFLCFCDSDKTLHIYMKDDSSKPYAKEIKI